MFLIPGQLVALVTFPGVIIHELAHHISCKLADVPVYETCYFRYGNPAGYVIHAPTINYRSTFLITVAPFLLNTTVALIMFYIAANTSVVNGLFYWLGFSIGMHAFPSSIDATSLWQHSIYIWRQNPIALLGFPIVILIVVANILSVLWFDLVYAFVLLFAVNPQVVTDFLKG